MTAETNSKIFFGSDISKLAPGDAFFELAQELSDTISWRAYQLFESRGSLHGHDREDWLEAAWEILLNVPVDITDTETELTIVADVPGGSEKGIEVRVTPRSV
jgi:HSP20 family molecular chaperone IbpA